VLRAARASSSDCAKSDARIAVGLHLDETDSGELVDRLANRGSGHAEPPLQFVVVEQFARLERAVEDRVTDLLARHVSQQKPLGLDDRLLVDRNRHVNPPLVF
jgi:hypothetical protein